MTCPCRGCTDRKFLCHSQCGRYQEWKREYEETKMNRQEYVSISEQSKRRHWRSLKTSRRRWNG